MKGHPIPIPSTHQLYNWAVKLTSYLGALEQTVENPAPKALQLEHAKEGAKAVQNGLLMWDNTVGLPIVSKDGAWYTIDITPHVLVGIKDQSRR